MSFKYLIENVAPETNLQVQTGKKYFADWKKELKLLSHFLAERPVRKGCPNKQHKLIAFCFLS